MQILIASATLQEIAPFKEEFPTADILVSGVGLSMATYHLTKRLQQINYDLVIQAGMAGSFDNKSALGEVVMVKRDAFGASGIRESGHFYTITEKGLSEGGFPFTGDWLVNENSLLSAYPYRKTDAVSVDLVTDDAGTNGMVYKKFKAEIESMEGAALHLVCLSEEIPFLQLRAISNYVGERDKGRWRIEEAIKNLNNALSGIYSSLNHIHEATH